MSMKHVKFFAGLVVGVIRGLNNPTKAIQEGIPMALQDAKSFLGKRDDFRSRVIELCANHFLDCVRVDDRKAIIQTQVKGYTYTLWYLLSGVLACDSRLTLRAMPPQLPGMLRQVERDIPELFTDFNDGVVTVGKRLPAGADFAHAVGYLAGFVSSLDDELLAMGF